MLETKMLEVTECHATSLKKETIIIPVLIKICKMKSISISKDAAWFIKYFHVLVLYIFFFAQHFLVI